MEGGENDKKLYGYNVLDSIIYLLLSQITNWVKSKSYWVGLTDMVKEGTFVWGSSQKLDIKHWNDNQPSSGDWVAFSNGGLSTWSSSHKAEVVCQKGKQSLR